MLLTDQSMSHWTTEAKEGCEHEPGATGKTAGMLVNDAASLPDDGEALPQPAGGGSCWLEPLPSQRAPRA